MPVNFTKIILFLLTCFAISPLWAQGDATSLIADTRLAGDPGTCVEGQRYYNTTTHSARVCVATNTWGGLGGGSVTSVSFTGGIVTVATATSTPALTVAGTSGGIPYFSSTSAWASSAALGANLPVIGGGAGVAPTTGTVTGTGTVFVTNTSPTLVTPTLGVAAATTLNKITVTTPATGATLTLIDGKTFKVDNTIELAGTDSAVYTYPASTATLASIGLTNTFTGRQNATGAASTAPMKSGTVAGKPATCVVGDLYFATDATAGQNIYECAATNTFTQQLNSGAGGGGGYATIQVGGTPVAQETTVNLIAGSGITPVCVDNSGSSRTDCTLSSNFAVALSIATAQAGKTNYCDDNSGTTNYACSLGASALLQTYQAGQTIFLNPSVTCTAGCTVNIDSVGTKNVKKKDCTTDPGGVLVINQPQWMWYNGSLFCLVNN